jgi:formylglycine-generating enzyme required for sulfatase activity
MPAATLADRIAGAPLEISEVLSLLLAICGSLREIHNTGLAHANLTPRNIGLPGEGRVEIETFPAPPPNATVMMTEPKYAAPEQLLTQATMGGTAHTQSDIYVLGFVAYEALAGRTAFYSQLFKEAGEAESDLFWMKWHADPARHLQPLRDCNASAPDELCVVIERMSAKDPAERFGNLDELKDAIEQLQHRLETTEDLDLASLSGAIPQPAQTMLPGKRKTFVPALLFLFLFLCGGAAWLLFGNRKPGAILATSWRFIEARAGAWTAGHKSKPLSRPLQRSMETGSGPMVLVAAGSFVMGSSAVANEGPARTVYLPAFYIDKYEVSNARYRAFTDSTGYFQPPSPSWDPDYFAKSSLPVINVSWRDAQAFCVAAGKRLPSEAEWEKAARGSSPGSRFWANWTVNGLANLKRAGFAAPAPIGTVVTDVSPFGAYDMAGNVHEWVNDAYGLYSGNPVALEGGGTAKVVRGGSFALSPQELSPSWRASLEASTHNDSPVGFRCAADPRFALEAPSRVISRPRGQ